MRWKRSGTALFTALFLFIAGQVHATVMLQLDLQELTGRADKIFRGTVISVKESMIEAGGGELPSVTYRIAVDEMFKGEPTVVKGDEAVVEIDRCLVGDALDIVAKQVSQRCNVMQAEVPADILKKGNCLLSEILTLFHVQSPDHASEMSKHCQYCNIL